MIDFHSHIVPGVDDGARDLDEARAALAALRDQGVRRVVTTPHLQGSLTANARLLETRLAELDAGWERLRAVAAEFPELSLGRGAEVMMDTLTPDLGDPRTRLAGTAYALVEFPYLTVPPNADQPLFHLKVRGWTPVIAHPERYGNVDARLRDVEQWKRMGAYLQVNAGSLLGRNGPAARELAWTLLRRGWVEFLSSDHHARGRVALAEARESLLAHGGEEQAELLLETNAARLLAGESPLEVPPLQSRRSLLRTLFRRR